MSIDLQDPITVGRHATQAVSRHASDAVDLARSVDLQAPAAAVKRVRKRANRAAKHLEHQVDHVSKRAATRVQAESRRVATATGRPRRGRKVLVTVLVIAGGAAVVAVLARRMRHMGSADSAPDPFGTAVRASEPTREFDGAGITTG
jgi:exonuclease VII large subunit